MLASASPHTLEGNARARASNILSVGTAEMGTTVAVEIVSVLLARETVLVRRAAEESRQPGTEERPEGGTTSTDDGEVNFDRVERDADVMVRVRIGIWWRVEEIVELNEANNGNDKHSVEVPSVSKTKT